MRKSDPHQPPLFTGPAPRAEWRRLGNAMYESKTLLPLERIAGTPPGYPAAQAIGELVEGVLDD